MSGLSRRDFLRLAAVGAGSSVVVTSCEDEQLTDYHEMLSNGETVPKSFSYIHEVSQDLVEDVDPHGRTAELKGSNEFMVTTVEGNYKRFGPWGLMTLPGAPDRVETWDKLASTNLNGPELFFVWESEGQVLESAEYPIPYTDLKPLPVMELAKEKSVEVLPDVRYALCDIVKNADGQAEFRFNPNKAKYLIDNYPNVVGFTIDEPFSLSPKKLYGVLMDWQKFLQDYGDSNAGLPLHLTYFGKRYAEGSIDTKNKDSFKKDDPIRKIVLKLFSIAKEKFKMIGGGFYYEFNADPEKEDTITLLNKIRAAYRREWSDVVRKLAPKNSWLVCPSHDETATNESDEPDRYSNFQKRADGVPLLGSFKNSPTKLYLLQVISAMANNPSYSRVLFWNFPYNGGIGNPYDHAILAINETRNILSESSNYFSGEIIDYYTLKVFFSYSVKEISVKNTNGDTEREVQRANCIFVDSENGSFPSKFSTLVHPGKYIDTITQLVIEIDEFGNLVQIPGNIPENTVFAFVPAE